MEDRAIEGERVVFAAFSTGVASNRQVIPERRGQELTAVLLGQPLSIHADRHGSKAKLEELIEENASVSPPQRIPSFQPNMSQELFAVDPKVFEKNIAEDNYTHALGLESLERREHRAGIDVVWREIGSRNSVRHRTGRVIVSWDDDELDG